MYFVSTPRHDQFSYETEFNFKFRTGVPENHMCLE